MEKLGGKPQKLLWASTGTKEPAYSDVKYIEALIAPDTINTVPKDALIAFNEQGKVNNSLENDLWSVNER
ncbi:transaldolase family protein [Mucilaginibacter sp. 14171R-50]|uniref:transaldolase family protein n=1 Tax=Mucilaginibacter sp. 14171R-50 TaxID=2703789 RepID=UPI002102C3B3|nr:transaldolase family protein [Mucilaginibacter sp. 14171R-50]